MKELLIRIPTHLMLCFLISTGGLFRYYKANLQYEIMTPITCMSIVSILFFFGVVGHLRAGVYFVLVLSAMIYAVTLFRIIHGTVCEGSAHLKKAARSIITPSAVLLLLFVVTATYANIGQQVAGWDEFSHWATVVKHMVFYDTLGCDQNYSFVTFKTYPPAMALFQYCAQRISIMLNPQMVFSEEDLFIAWQVFAASFLLPFIGKMDFGKPYAWIVSPLLFISMRFMRTDELVIIYIDPFLGLIAGAGMAMVLRLSRENNRGWHILTLMTISTMVLTKDAGMLFAVFTAIAYLVMTIPGRGRRNFRAIVSACVFPCIAVIIPKTLWTLCVIQNHAQSPFGKIDFRSFFYVLTGVEDSYRAEVILLFQKKLFSPFQFLSFFGRNLSSLILLVLLLLLAFLVCRAYWKQDPQIQSRFMTVSLLLSVASIAFLGGLLLVYMYALPPEEALWLASYERYMIILFYQLIFFCVLSFVSIIEQLRWNQMLAALLLLGVCISTGAVKSAIDYCIRIPVWYANEIRKQYQPFVEFISSHTEDDSAIWFISQGNDGYDYWCTRFCLMPRTVNPMNTIYKHSWSIGRPDPKNGIWTNSLTAEEWRTILMEECNYVALFRLNELFYEDFSCLFENPDDVGEESLFFVNKETGYLEICR